jgi:hypothetical protein
MRQTRIEFLQYVTCCLLSFFVFWNMIYSSVSQPPGLEDLLTRTWNIRETKNLSEIAMKSSFFKDKVTRKIYYRDIWPQNSQLPGQKTKNSFYRDLDLKRLGTTDL